MNIKLLLAASTLSLLALGCDDSGGGSGVSNSKKISELSESDKTKVCNALQTKFTGVESDSTKLSCTLQGFTFAQEDADECAMVRDDCIDEAEGVPSEDTDLGCNTDEGELEDCGNVTVGELNACVDALAEAIEALAKRITCSSTAADLSAAEDFASPEACTKLESRCSVFKVPTPEP